MVSLVVEDGSIVEGANSYASLAWLDSYFANRGNDAWAAKTAADKNEAAIRAMDYLESSYAFVGYRVDPLQPLNWPRAEVYLDNGRYMVSPYAIPSNVMAAQAELAFRATVGPLIVDVERSVGAIKEITVGPLTTVYQDDSTGSSGAAGGTSYTVVDRLLAPYLAPYGVTTLVRV